jgi:predicted dienelactone hydrolase
MRPSFSAVVFAVVALFAPALSAATDYDPLRIDKVKPTIHDLTVSDAKRNREVPIRVFLPAHSTAVPVVLFSHGLGGSRAGGTYLGEHWSARGYVVVALQHPGSDESVWKNQGAGQRMNALRQAANAQNLLLRLADVSVVLDQLEIWNRQTDHPLKGRLDLAKVGMSGHSFGAVTTQGVSGQTPAIGRAYTDPRIDAALPMSPSVPRAGDPARAFGNVKIPWLLMTGTKDDSPIGDMDAASRLKVFPALPAGDKYQLVLDGAEHSAFADQREALKARANPNHHKAILATSTAFWDAYLKGDEAAKAWLQGEAVRGVLEKADVWEKK